MKLGTRVKVDNKERFKGTIASMLSHYELREGVSEAYYVVELEKPVSLGGGSWMSLMVVHADSLIRIEE